MVVVILRNLGAAAAGVGAVAVEFGFSEQAGAGAGEDAERAVFQAGADGGDAEGEGVDAFVDGEAGAAEFGDLVGAGRSEKVFRKQFRNQEQPQVFPGIAESAKVSCAGDFVTAGQTFGAPCLDPGITTMTTMIETTAVAAVPSRPTNHLSSSWDSAAASCVSV